MDVTRGSGGQQHARVTFRDVLSVRSFRALWLAQVQSQIGDQLSRVAVMVFVFGSTGSTAITAIVYALTFAPAILGGVLLGGLADRLPRRAVMIGCDVLRAALVAAMAVPGVPVAVVCVLLVLVVFVGQPFLAAEAALIPRLVEGERYVAASGLRMVTNQVAQLAGFAAGGIVVAALGARGSLALNAATFGASALLIRFGVREPRTHADAPQAGASARGLAGVRSAAAVVWRDRRLRALAGLGWLAAFHVVPEGLAVPFAAEVGGGPRAVGLLMAAAPAGTALGAYLIVRLPPRVRSALLGPLAVASGVPMILCGLRPGIVVALVLWAALGLFAAYQVPAAADFVQGVPDERRGQVFALVAAGMTAVQGVGIIVFGVLAESIGTARTIAVAGVVAAALAGLLTVLLRSARSVTGRARLRSTDTSADTAAGGSPEAAADPHT